MSISTLNILIKNTGKQTDGFQRKVKFFYLALIYGIMNTTQDGIDIMMNLPAITQYNIFNEIVKAWYFLFCC